VGPMFGRCKETTEKCTWGGLGERGKSGRESWGLRASRVIEVNFRRTETGEAVRRKNDRKSGVRRGKETQFTSAI